MRYGRADDLIALNFRRGSSAWLKYKKKKSRSGLYQNTRLLIWKVLHQWTWQYPRLGVVPLGFMVEASASGLSCQHKPKESMFVSFKTPVVWPKAVISCKSTQYLSPVLKHCDAILCCYYGHWTHWPGQFVLSSGHWFPAVGASSFLSKILSQISHEKRETPSLP